MADFTFVHSFPGVVEPSSYRPPLSFLPRYNKFYHFLETLYSSTLLICTYQSKHLCLKKVAIGYTLASSSMFWFPTWAFLFLVISVNPTFSLVVLSDRPTLLHMSMLVWIQYCFVHFVVQTSSLGLNDHVFLTLTGCQRFTQRIFLRQHIHRDVAISIVRVWRYRPDRTTHRQRMSTAQLWQRLVGVGHCSTQLAARPAVCRIDRTLQSNARRS